MMVFGYDDAPEGHCEVLYENCQLDVESGVVGGRAGLGRGFEVCSFKV
jgi:acyl-CoA dehydrogenase